jgi:GNAT superfamily N-acetyltransferase
MVGAAGDIIVRRMGKDDLWLVGSIDRTEKVTRLYRSTGGRLSHERADIDVRPWTKEQVAAHVKWLEYELGMGGTLFGAFKDDAFQGLAVLGNRPVGGDPKTAQLVFLHVSAAYRRSGVGSAMLDAVRREAKMRGKKRLYISATPSGSAVGFYASRGAVPLEKPDPGLFAKEPEDVHLMLEL